jgi:small nuclear ribonucleoprotein (snRNP)-like protein
METPMLFLKRITEEGARVSVILKDSEKVLTGKIVSFDLNLNLVIETYSGAEFIRGGAVITISPNKN